MNDLLYANAIDEVINRVRERKPPGDPHGVWDSIVAQFRQNGCCEIGLIDVVEEEIRAYLASVRGLSLRQLWSWSVSRLAESIDYTRVPAKQMRIDLEINFSECITELARDEAGLL